MSESDEEFWRPLWKRVGMVLLGVVWAAVELHRGNTFWPIVAGVLVALSLGEFFLSGRHRR